MKTTKYLLPLFVALASACQQEPVDQTGTGLEVTLFAKAESYGDTKAVLVEGGTTAVFKWSETDYIALPGINEVYTAKLKSGAGESSANFGVTKSIQPEENLVYAAFPYNIVSGGDIIYPAVYNNYTNGSLQTPMLAVLPDGRVTDSAINYDYVSFKHLGGVIKVVVSEVPAGVDKMVFTANNGAEINGTYRLKDEFNTTDIINNQWSESFTRGSSFTEFNFTATTSVQTKTFYVPVPAGVVFSESGFSVSLMGNGAEVEKIDFPLSEAYTVARGRLLRGAEKFSGIRFQEIYEDLVFSHTGETRTIGVKGDFSTISNWEVKAESKFGETYATVTKGAESVDVTLPSSRFAARGPVELTLWADGQQIDRITVYQDSWWVTDRGEVTENADGSVTLSSQMARLRRREMTKNFYYEIKTGANALSAGYLLLEGSGADGISYQFRLGDGQTRNFSSAGSYSPVKGTATMNPCYNMNGPDIQFISTTAHPVPTALPGNSTLKFMLSTYTPDDGSHLRLFSRAWIDDDLILNDWGGHECPWFDGSGHNGTTQYLGLMSASGSLTINSIEELAENGTLAQPSGAAKHILFERFEHGNTVPEPDYWSYIGPGTAAWQIECSGKAKHSYLENGNLVLMIEKDSEAGGKTQSGAIRTADKLSFKNCRIDVRAKWTDGGGTVGRAIWMMPQWGYEPYSGWPACGEIDIMEHTYWTSYIRMTLHSYYIHNIGDSTESGNPTAGRVKYVGADKGYKSKDWNIYSVEMTGDDVIYYVNGTQIGTYSNKKLADEATKMQWPFGGPFFLILSIGTAGSADSDAADLPATMLVDYVKVTAL